MVYYKNKKKKMPYRRRRRYRPRGKMQITKQIGSAPVSKSQIVKLKYCEQISLDPGVGLVGKYVFNAGGCFDPNVTGTGHQPMGFDQWMNFYEHFVVLGSKISAVYQTTGLQPQDGNGIVGIILKSNNTTSATTINEYVETQGCRFRGITPVGGNNSTTVSNRYSAKKFLGRSNILSDPTLKGNVSADPTESAYYEVFAGPSNTGYNLGVVNVLVRIEYIVAFIEPKPLPSS